MLSSRYKYDGSEGISLNKIQMDTRDAILGKLADKSYELKDADCVCSSNEVEILSRKDRYGLPLTTVICKKCGLIFLDPRMRVSDYEDFYKYHYRKLHLGKDQPDHDVFSFQVQRGHSILDYLYSNHINAGSVLEIGCSSGGILEVLKNNGWDITGVDLDSDYIQYGRNRGLNLINCCSEDLLREYDGTFDVIILSHVLEHFLDIKKELGIIYLLLKPQGYLYIEVPGIEHTLNDEGWFHSDFLKILQIQHTYYFNLNTLRQAVECNGYKMIAGNDTINSLFKKVPRIDGYSFKNYYNSNLEFLKKQEANLMTCSDKSTGTNSSIVEKPKKQKAVLFGASKLGEIAIMALEDQYDIICIFDNDSNKWGKQLRNICIMPPHDLIKYQCAKIIITSMYREEISRQLNDMGVREYVFFKIEMDNIAENKREHQKDINRALFDDPNIHTVYETGSLVAKQYKYKRFNRMDIVVRYLAIEEFYGKNKHGFELYSKMQKLRGQQLHTLDRFIELIRSIKEYGFDNTSGIVLGEGLQLIDGSHRIACALYFDVPYVPVTFIPDNPDFEYSLDWFTDCGFGKEEIAIIDNKAKEVFKRWNLYFPIILWPPAMSFCDEITKELGVDYKVISVKDYHYEHENDLDSVIKGIYAIDNIEQWKIDKKIQYMKAYDRSIRVIMVEIGDPDFREKSINGMPISQEVERIKRKYRDKYSTRIVDYFHDVLLHIGDNYKHTKHVLQILNKDINIKEFLCSISSYLYALTKVDVPYMPDNFPDDYPLSKDIDLISSVEDFQAICNAAEKFAEKYSGSYQIKKLAEKDRLKIRFELNNFLCYQIDLSCKISCLSDLELREALERRKERSGFYVFDVKDEVIIREYEYENNPEKTHHLKYILSHKQE